MRRIVRIGLAAGACLLAGGCSDGSLAVQSGSADSAAQVATNEGSSGGPCDGNPCIGDWQTEAAKGGTVVQCSDGTWSHAGGLAGACSDHGGESDGPGSSSSQLPAANESATVSGAASGPCDGNPCIGDWQKEAAKGGAVVQCNDGTWSHAGGISGACSHHGGVSSGPPASTSATTSPPTTASPPSGSVQNLPVQCGYGVSGSSGVTCGFAENAFYEYWQASGGDPSQTATISVWSAPAQRSYQLSCDPGESLVDCTGTNASGVALLARFTQHAVSAYTHQQAAAYAASGKLGPNTGSAPSSTFTPGDENPNDASAAECENTMEIGPHSDCFVAQQTASDLAQGTWSAPGSDTVSEGSSTITFDCTTVGQENSQAVSVLIYRCVGRGDAQDWFEFPFT